MAKLEVVAETEIDSVWRQLRASAEAATREEPQLASQMNSVILSHDGMAGALSYQVARKLGDDELGAMSVREICLSSYAADPIALPAQVLDGFAKIREGRALYEVIADFAAVGGVSLTR